MLDWLTLKLKRESVSAEDWQKLEGRAGRVLAISRDVENPNDRVRLVTGNGEVVLDAPGKLEWVTVSRESIRSDSHQITVHAGYDLEITGSPARVLHGNNVFGSSDILECFRAMVDFVNRNTGVSLPLDPSAWRVTRVDVTQNYDLGSAAEVRQALSYLRHSEGGRYVVRTKSETVYWSPNSDVRSGKAYHKGPHLQYQNKKNQCQVTEEEIILADRLLRLELSLKNHFWREQSTKPWHAYTENDLNEIHNKFFSQLIGKIEVVEMDSILNVFEKVAPTKGQALAAFRTWSLIKAVGSLETQASMPRATWMRHRKVMFDAGLTWADLHAQNIVPLRRRTIELGQPVQSWSDLRMAA